MSKKKIVSIISILIAVLSAFTSLVGIISNDAHDPSSIMSVRGDTINLYGKGVYHHMSLEVAPQGIAQDYVTFFLAIPMLIISLIQYRKGSLRGKIIMTGTLGYFLVTYLFFTMMAMYNQLFLVWVILLSLSFYGFIVAFNSLDGQEIKKNAIQNYPVKFIGMFLIFTSLVIGLLWLSIIIPPMLKGTIPRQVEHYTTLVVQALDLSILLPAAFISGLLIIKKKNAGYKSAPVYIVFLFILMTALSAKVIAMKILGYNVIPVIFIIPAFNISALIFMVITISKIPPDLSINRVSNSKL